MTKILLLVAGDNGTIGSCSLNMYEALKEADNIEVKCAVIHHFENGYAGFSNAVFFDKEHQGGLLKQIKWLRAIKRDFQPDVTISTLFGVSTLSVISGGNDKKVGIFHSPHQQIKAFGKLQYLLTLLQYNFIYPKLDKLCCVSKEVYNSLKVFPLIREKKCDVVYNVHNLKRIARLSKEDIMDNSEREIFRHPTIIYCGRFDKNKAPVRALDAFAKANMPKDSQFVLIGEDQQGLSENLLNKASELGVRDRVHVLGRKSNPYPYFKSAKALISSSYSEGLPGVMIEALALGIPVVTTNSSEGVWEIFSCHNKYNPQLNSVVETDCGYISSNLARKDLTNYDLDIQNLAVALGEIICWPKNVQFSFAQKVTGENIVNQLISNLK